MKYTGIPLWLRGQKICPQFRRPEFDTWAGKIPWRRKWQPTPAFLPGNPIERVAQWATIFLFFFQSEINFRVYLVEKFSGTPP